MNLKCPKCGGQVMYDPATDSMKCDRCQGLTTSDAFSTLDGRDPTEQVTYASFKLNQDGTGEVITSGAVGASKTDAELPEEKTAEPEKKGFRLAGATPESTEEPPKKMGLRLAADADEPKMSAPMGAGPGTVAKAMGFGGGATFAPDIPEEEFPSYQEELMETRIYKCSSCGSELMLNNTEASTFCGFCGSPTIVFDRISNEVKPQKIIPFKITEEQALLCIKDRFAYGGYIPDAIRNLTVEKIRGIYMPYWLFTTYARKSMSLKQITDDYTHYAERDGACRFDRITFDASLKLNNQLASRLEPFYMNELVDFDMTYLSGYYADRYDVPYHAMKSNVAQRADEMIDKELIDTTRFAGMLKYQYQKSNENFHYRVEQIEYAALPAYFVNFRFKGESYSIIVNGQTGKVVGNIPEDKGQLRLKFMKNIILSCLIFAALCGAFFAMEQLMIVTILPVLVAFIQFFGGMNDYKKHKEDRLRMASTSMQSYINEREDY